MSNSNFSGNPSAVQHALSFAFDGKTIRTQTDENQMTWFCATDICSALGYENSRQAIQKNCKTEGVSNRYTLTNGGTQLVAFISEPNVYRLIMRSRLPGAERFEAWVFEEVLPTIRKTGGYSQEMVERLQLVEAQIAYQTFLSGKGVNLGAAGLWKLSQVMNVLNSKEKRNAFKVYDATIAEAQRLIRQYGTRALEGMMNHAAKRTLPRTFGQSTSSVALPQLFSKEV